ncbi:unnamed protein product [Phytophthora fragariaefolia]|uniref:Unnamed protein product n=1 Tax=Phytophthora fragariaefolia TaxID=1490495 RepID=A0A9W6XXT2_9STRA|nr:unnamed protein product [Phytophthora fragariaefolia]
MFMPDKPHRYGSKLFIMCDSKTAFEVYAGKRNVGDVGDPSFDRKTGAAAVVRNLAFVLSTDRRHAWNAVVFDRFYPSVLLTVELLCMNVYTIGTVKTNRLGYDQNVKDKRQSRPASIPRESFTFSRSVAVPTMIAFHWLDRKPVHYLCTSAVMTAITIMRNVKRVGPITVPCPAAVTDYQRWVGGVDVHDQLRLQTYSLQTSTKFLKYYKSLFVGFVDLALVNAFISHKQTAKINGTPPMKRGEWYGVLQNHLLQLKAEDLAGVVVTPAPVSNKRKRTPVRITHALEQSDDWVAVSSVQKRRQRSCKFVHSCERTARRSRLRLHSSVSAVQSTTLNAGSVTSSVVSTKAF